MPDREKTHVAPHKVVEGDVQLLQRRLAPPRRLPLEPRTRDPRRYVSHCATHSLSIALKMGEATTSSQMGRTSTRKVPPTAAALKHGLSVILCCGETLQEREEGKTVAVVEEQIGEVVKTLKPEDWK